MLRSHGWVVCILVACTSWARAVLLPCETLFTSIQAEQDDCDGVCPFPDPPSLGALALDLGPSRFAWWPRTSVLSAALGDDSTRDWHLHLHLYGEYIDVSSHPFTWTTWVPFSACVALQSPTGLIGRGGPTASGVDADACLRRPTCEVALVANRSNATRLPLYGTHQFASLSLEDPLFEHWHDAFYATRMQKWFKPLCMAVWGGPEARPSLGLPDASPCDRVPGLLTLVPYAVMADANGTDPRILLRALQPTPSPTPSPTPIPTPPVATRTVSPGPSTAATFAVATAGVFWIGVAAFGGLLCVRHTARERFLHLCDIGPTGKGYRVEEDVGQFAVPHSNAYKHFTTRRAIVRGAHQRLPPLASEDSDFVPPDPESTPP